MKAPHFWSHGLDPQSREAAPVVRAMLTPLAAVYTWAGARRIKRVEPYRCGVPVICVGNVTIGGTGKSPVVAALRKWFSSKGIRAASLSRGYKGKLTGPLKVISDTHTAADVGDEPLMLSHTGESWIGADRAEAAKAMVTDGVQVILMDDGFQNPQLYKDHSMLVIDSEAPFGNGYVIPKGPLREPVKTALSRTHSILLMGHGEQPDGLSTYKPILRASLEPTEPLPNGPLVVFAGIGRPQKVFDAILKHGGTISESVPYSDHYTYTKSDLKYLRLLAKERNATLVTTEKDYMRLPANQRTSIHAWPVKAQFEKTEQLDGLFRIILESLDHDS